MMLNRLFKLSAVIAIAAVSAIQAQDNDTLNLRNSRFKVNTHAGVEFNNLSKLKSFFNGTKDSFRKIGISMPGQAVYSYSSSYGICVLYSLKDHMYFGAGFEHSATKANSFYREAGGIIDLNSLLTADKFFLTGQYILFYKEYFSPLAEMHLGLLRARFECAKKIALNQPVSEWSYERLSGSRNTLLISLFFGAQNRVYKNLVLFEKLGYQFSDINTMPGEIESNGLKVPGTIFIHFDFRGVLLQFGAEYQF